MRWARRAPPVRSEGDDSVMIPDVTCPECEQGKHQNCTLTVLTDDDLEVQCVCAAFDHEPADQP